MSDSSISALNSVRSGEISAPAQTQTTQTQPAQTEVLVVPRSVKSTAPLPASKSAQVEVSAAATAAAAASRLGSPADPKAVKTDDKPALPIINSSDVSLHFKVDDKTNDVTVFVVDKASKKVLRSIPASELAKLGAGDLLKLTA